MFREILTKAIIANGTKTLTENKSAKTPIKKDNKLPKKGYT